MMDPELAAKERALTGLLRDLAPVVVAYSGGVDSTYLAAAAHETLGRDRALAATAVSPAVARRELADARDTARRFGWSHLEIETHEWAREEYARNASDRCYWCKTELFEVLRPVAAARSARIVTGTNADDLGDYRPGLTAAGEHDVTAPLAEAGLGKADVRALSAAIGLPSAAKVASPCLASRFAYGVRVTPEGLARIDRAEEYVRSLGFRELRVRDHGDLARLEVEPSEVQRAASLHAEIVAALTELGFRYVTLDLAGFRSGSLNEVLAIDKLGRPR
ncbi:MAG: ATP-dependent sacrificial sulfur transferase LarE [Actinomycetota bacterium]